jgi:hypothetical protein
MKGSIECTTGFLYPMIKMRNYRRREAKFQRRTGEHYDHGGGGGGGGVREFFRRAMS